MVTRSKFAMPRPCLDRDSVELFLANCSGEVKAVATSSCSGGVGPQAG